jgi:predicted hotdog family 3-hydroxylacyl-ACP dehydratase
MITGYSLEQVLPHAAPMILLSRFIEASDTHAVCSVTITETSPFYQPDSAAVPAYVGIEYMAQTIAAFAGANGLARGEAVKIGFLLGCRKYQPVVTQFNLADELIVSVTEVISEPGGLGVFDCTIRCQQQVVVTAKLNVFQPDDHQAWLTE